MNCHPLAPLVHRFARHLARRLVHHAIRHKVATVAIIAATGCAGGALGITALLPPTTAPGFVTPRATPVPEPGTLALLVPGIGGVFFARRRVA